MNEDLRKKQQQRVAFLNKLYEMADGSTDAFVNGAEVAAQIGFKNGDKNQIIDIANYLKGEGLIRVISAIGNFPASVGLTHSGLLEIEAALGYPDRSTEHFMPINILNVTNMIGSTIQQGTTNSQQNMSISNNAAPKIEEFLQQVRAALSELNLPNDQNLELNAELTTAEAQVKSPRPKASILRESLQSMKNILESVTGSAIGGYLATQIPILLALL